jgi:hypothetical protein
VRDLSRPGKSVLKASVHAHNLIVYDGTARQTVKRVAKLLPHLDRKATAALIVESINPI